MSKYDWSGAKKWAKYIATDEDGSTYQFDSKPVMGENCWYLEENYTSKNCFPFFNVNLIEDWKDSLEERPK